MIKLRPGQRMIRKHVFRYQLSQGRNPALARATVYNARTKVEIVLSKEHVWNALKRFGRGDPANCAGAVCIYTHAHLFPHPVSDVEFIDSRVYCITAYTKDGLPSKCIAYIHEDEVAKSFDSRAGLKRLLADLHENGPKTLHLRPLTSSSGSTNKPRSERNREDGSRTLFSHVTHPPKKGSALRIFRTTRGPSAQ